MFYILYNDDLKQSKKKNWGIFASRTDAPT